MYVEMYDMSRINVIIKWADRRTWWSNEHVKKCKCLMSNVKNITKNEQSEECSDKTSRSEDIMIKWDEDVKMKKTERQTKKW